MSKFCYSCGTQLPDGVAFCNRCGAKQPVVQQPTPQSAPVYTAPAPAPVNPAPAPVNPAPDYIPDAPKSKKGLIIGLCSGGAVLILVVVLLFVFLGGGGYEGAVQNYVAVRNGDAAKVESLAPYAFWVMEGDPSCIDATLKVSKQHNRMLENFGPDAVYSMEILTATEMDAGTLAELTEELMEDGYGAYGLTQIEEGYLLTAQATVTGSYQTDSDVATIAAIKIDGEWYLTKPGRINFPATDYV